MKTRTTVPSTRPWMRSALMIATLPMVGLFAGCTGSSPTVSPRPHTSAPAQTTAEPAGANWSFTDATQPLGLTATYRNGEEAARNAILESLGGGVGILDYDVDGHWDLVFPGGGQFVSGRDQLQGLPTQLWRAQSDGPSQRVTDAAGLSHASFYTHGVAIADFDNDGFADILVTGFGGLQFWQNLGDGTFQERAQTAGLVDTRWSSSAAWGDLNGDGNVDLYIAHYVDWSFANNPVCRGPANGRPDVCPPRQFEGVDDVVYFSEGNGRFRDATQEAELVRGGKGLGVVITDLDQDGDVDVYVANDTENNFLYWNDGRGHFTEGGVLAGAAVDDRGVANGSMGIAVGDYDGDQRFDLLVANYEDEAFALYRQVEAQQFLHASQQTGITSLGVLNVGFGTILTDIDADGDLDAVVANGHIMHFPRSAPVRQNVMLLKNNRGQRFERVELPTPEYLATGHAGRGVAMGDLNGDGIPDFVFANNNEPAAVLLNSTPPIGRRLQIHLIGRQSNRDGIGAVVKITADGVTQTHAISGGSSYLSSSPGIVYATIAAKQTKELSLTVIWPSGKTSRIAVGASTVSVDVVE